MEEKKKGKNFTVYEKNFLVDIIQKNKHIIENKKSDSSSLEEKASAWEQIASYYNASAQTGHRSTKQLKELYQVLKRNARKNLATDRAERYKTGGGTFISVSTDIDKKIIGAIKDQFSPDTNPFDSSAILLEETHLPILSNSTKSVADEVNRINPTTYDASSMKSDEYMSSDLSFSERKVDSQELDLTPCGSTPIQLITNANIETGSSSLTFLSPTSPQLGNISTTRNWIHPVDKLRRNSTQLGNTPKATVKSSDPVANPTSSPQVQNSPKSTRKRTHPVENLTAVIQNRKKIKNKLSEIEIENKKILLEEEIKQRRELHNVNLEYKKLLVEEQSLKVEGARLANELIKVDLLIKKKQLQSM